MTFLLTACELVADRCTDPGFKNNFDAKQRHTKVGEVTITWRYTSALYLYFAGGAPKTNSNYFFSQFIFLG